MINDSLKPLSRDSHLSYCAAAVKTPEGGWSLLSSDGRIILFDTLEVAKNVLPYLSEGRDTRFLGDDRLLFVPPLFDRINELMIISPYDPYDVPNNEAGVRSETRFSDWRNHIMWSYVILNK